MPVTFSDEEANTLYWALEKLDAEEGLNEDEQPVFRQVAEHVGEPHGGEDGDSKTAEETEPYFAVINDNPAPATSPEYEECVTICQDGAGIPLICREKADAFWIRDKRREGGDTPDINVYRMQLEPVDDPRNDGDSGE